MIKRFFGSDFWGQEEVRPGKQDPFAILRGEIDKVFDSVGNWAAERRGMHPRIDLAEREDGIDIEAELPGVPENQIDLTLAGNTLTIAGEKSSEREEQNKRYGLSERSYGRFTRSLTLPFEPEVNSVSATFRHGVLHVRVPKPEHLRAKPEKIRINPG